MRKVVYIAGPISHPSFDLALQNLHKFFNVENLLWRHGFSAINPAADLIAALMHGQYEHKDYLDKDEALVAKSDYIYMLPGWEGSVGAQKEYGWALKHNTYPVESLAGLMRREEALNKDWVDELPTDPDA